MERKWWIVLVSEIVGIIFLFVGLYLVFSQSLYDFGTYQFQVNITVGLTLAIVGVILTIGPLVLVLPKGCGNCSC